MPLLLLARGTTEAAGYYRRLDDRVLSLVPVVDDNGIATDQQTGTLWSIEGMGLEGPLAGRQLEPLDGYMAEWHVWAAYHPDTEIYGEGQYSPPLGFSMPELNLRRLSRTTVESVSTTPPGTLRLVVLWAEWCPPCRKKLPRLQELVGRYQDRGVNAVSIAIHPPDVQERTALKKFVREHNIQWAVYLIDDAAYRLLDADYRSQGGRGLIVPMVFIVNDQGTVVSVLEGDQIETIEETLDQLLSDAATT